jgi:hypothetical protein
LYVGAWDLRYGFVVNRFDADGGGVFEYGNCDCIGNVCLGGDTMKLWMTLISGALFGFGLAYSTMIHPETVLAFLTLHDLGLLLVLCTAVAVNLVVFQLVPRLRSKPVFGDTFEKRPFMVNRQATLGSVLFGIGWGICGVCPAPALTGLGTGNWKMLVVLVCIFIGAGLHGVWAEKFSKN